MIGTNKRGKHCKLTETRQSTIEIKFIPVDQC